MFSLDIRFAGLPNGSLSSHSDSRRECLLGQWLLLVCWMGIPILLEHLCYPVKRVIPVKLVLFPYVTNGACILRQGDFVNCVHTVSYTRRYPGAMPTVPFPFSALYCFQIERCFLTSGALRVCRTRFNCSVARFSKWSPLLLSMELCLGQVLQL